jgi:hypothetical protein
MINCKIFIPERPSARSGFFSSVFYPRIRFAILRDGAGRASSRRNFSFTKIQKYVLKCLGFKPRFDKLHHFIMTYHVKQNFWGKTLLPTRQHP